MKTRLAFFALFLCIARPLAAAEPVMVALSTGSQLATWTLPATGGPRHAVPVVFLHGGPGLYTEARRFDEGAPLRSAGFDTIYFDQAGGGRSARLRAGDYSLERAVADLEALRVAIGQEKLVLWGNSYGAVLATIYANRFPDRVAGLILTAPGMFPGYGGKRDYGRTNRDRVEYSKAVRDAVERIDRDGGAAEAVLPQDAAGVLFDELVAGELIDGVVCKGSSVQPPALAGGGNLYAQRAIARDVKAYQFGRAALPPVPAIIMRGGCDFLPLASAQKYADLLGVKVTEIADAGHGLLEQRAAVDAALLDFAKGPLAATR